MSSLRVASMSLEMVTLVAPLELRIKRHSRALADQLNRAADSVALNTGEAEYSDPGNKRARFFTASGSANETRLALRLGIARRYLGAEDAAEALELLDQIVAILWRLTHPQ